jgi:hypothetical protein
MVGTLHVQREVALYLDNNRAYRVRIDGKTVGRIEDGQARDFVVEAGYHALQLRTFYSGSHEATFFVDDDVRVCFLCRPRYRAIAGLAGIIRTKLGKMRGIELREVPCVELDGEFPK